MTTRGRKTGLALAMSLSLFAGVIFGGQQPASAVTWTLGYAFGNTDTLCLGCTKSNSNAVALWQTALTLNFNDNGNGINGVFSGGNQWATGIWQTRHGLTSDGIVGPNTWNAARFWHVGAHPVTENATWQYWHYTDGPNNAYVHLQTWKSWATWYEMPYFCQSTSQMRVITGDSNSGNWGIHCE